MGFGSFFKRLTKIKPLKVVSKALQPKKIITAVATGGLSLIAPKPFAKKLESTFVPSPQKALAIGVSAFTGSPGPLIAAYSAPQATITPRPVLGGGQPMGFNLGNFLGGVGGALQTLTANTAYSGAGQLAGAFGSAFTPAAVRPPAPMAPRPPAPSIPQPYRSPLPGVGSGMKQQIYNILTRLRGNLGRSVSLNSVITMIRRMGKSGLAPAAIATALGITIEHLAQLITAHSAKRTRRMNPANIHALRRSVRRLKSFHKLCVHVDALKTRHTRSRPAPCGKRR